MAACARRVHGPCRRWHAHLGGDGIDDAVVEERPTENGGNACGHIGATRPVLAGDRDDGHGGRCEPVCGESGERGVHSRIWAVSRESDEPQLLDDGEAQRVPCGVGRGRIHGVVESHLHRGRARGTSGSRDRVAHGARRTAAPRARRRLTTRTHSGPARGAAATRFDAAQDAERHAIALRQQCHLARRFELSAIQLIRPARRPASRSRP